MPQADFKAGTKVCERAKCALAGIPQPLANFTKHKDRPDGLRGECRACHAVVTKEYKPGGEKNDPVKDAREKIKKESVKVGTAIAKVAKQAKSVTGVEELASNIMSSFGGAKQFADRLVNTIDDVDCSSANKIRGLLGAASIVGEASKIQAASAQDLDLMTEEEMDAKIRELLREVQNEGAIDVDFEVQAALEVDVDDIQEAEIIETDKNLPVN